MHMINFVFYLYEYFSKWVNDSKLTVNIWRGWFYQGLRMFGRPRSGYCTKNLSQSVAQVPSS